MRLSNNNFYKGSTLLKNGNGAIVYTYESYNALYDVMEISGRKYYQKNMGGYSDKVELIHKAIEKHYGI